MEVYDSLSSESETTAGSSNEETGRLDEAVAAGDEEEEGREFEGRSERTSKDEGSAKGGARAQRDATKEDEPVDMEKEEGDGSHLHSVNATVAPGNDDDDDDAAHSSPIAFAGARRDATAEALRSSMAGTEFPAGAISPVPASSAPSPSPSPAKPRVRRKSRTSKTGRKKKPIDMPRRPLSGYNYFFREERGRWLSESEQRNAHKDEAGGLFSAMGKAIAQRWKDISPEDAERYKELAAKDMERYKREMDQYHTAAARMKRLEETAEEDSDGGNRGHEGSNVPTGKSKKASKATASSLQLPSGMSLLAPTEGGDDYRKEAFEFADSSGGYYRETDLFRMNANHLGVMSGGMGMPMGGMSMVDPAFMGCGGYGYGSAAQVMYPAGAANLSPAFWGAAAAAGMGGPAGVTASSFGNPYLDPNTMAPPAGAAEALGGYQGEFGAANPASFQAQIFTVNGVNPGAYALAGSTSPFPGMVGSGVGLGAAPPAQFLAAQQPPQPIFSVMGATGAGGFGVYGPGEMFQMGPDSSMGGTVGAGGGTVMVGGDDQMMRIQQMIHQQQPQQQPQEQSQEQEEAAGDSFM